METDMSLIEISGEDDSLLSMQQITQNDDVSPAYNDNCYFSCSPLLRIPRSTRSSSIESIEREEDQSKPSSSSCEDSTTDNNNVNKENVNLNKSEMPKLSLEPQQMKRKKKGGAYNLRKSLAWDRAFFTEEGVLDPLELSLLSGNLGKSCGEMLSVIHEGRESLSGELDNAVDSPDLQALEDNLFKELPSTTPNGSRIRKIASTLSPKVASPARDKRGPAPAAKRKVLSAHDINRSASKRNGCPLPVASSSLKRPPNTNTTKVATKDYRVSKLLAPKQDPSVVSKTSRGSITSASHSKSNYISRPVNVQKNTGLKGTSTNTKTVQNDAKSGPAGKLIVKSTAQQARRNVVKVSPAPEIHSSSNMQLSQVRQVNNSSELVPNSSGPTAAHPAPIRDSNASKIPVSFSQNASHGGGIMLQTQPQTAKPSGLRMPSPSLGFFGQSKPSGAYSLSQGGTQSCSFPESNIPNFSRAGALNPIHQRPPRPLSNISANSSRSCPVTPIVESASCEKNKSNLDLNNMQQVLLQAKFNSENHVMMNHKQQVDVCDDVNPQPLDLAESCKIQKISCMKHTAPQSNNNKLPLQSGPCEQLEDERSILNVSLRSTDSAGACVGYLHSTSPLSLPVEHEAPSETNNTIVDQHVEDTQYNPCIKDHNICSESQSAVTHNWNRTASEVHEDRLSSIHEAKTQSPQQADLMKPDACEVDVISNAENQGHSDTLFEDNRSAEDLNIYDSSNAADACLKAEECGATPYRDSHCADVGPTKDGTTRIDYINRGLHAGDTQMPSVIGNLLFAADKILISTSQVDNSNSMSIDDPGAMSSEPAELLNPGLVSEPVFQDNCRSLSSGSLLHGKESPDKDVLQCVKSIESRDACGGEVGRSNVLCSVSSVNQDSDFDAAEKVGCPRLENATASADSEPVVEYFRHDVERCNGANALALERIRKSHMIDTVISDGVNVNNFSPNSGDFSGDELENPHITSQISCVMQLKVASGMNDVSEMEGVIDKQFDSSVANFTAFSGLQAGNDACYGERSKSVQHNDCTSGMHDVKEQSAEQAKLINSCSREAQLLNQSQEICGERRSFEDVSPVGGSGSEIPHSPHLCEIIENEPSRANNTMNDVFMEDAPVQSLHDSLLTDSCNSNVSASAANKSSLVVDDIVTQPKEHSELQNLDLVIEKVPLENHRLCLDDNLLMDTSNESQEKETLENVSVNLSEEGNGFPSDSKSFDACIQISSPMCDVGLNVDKNAEHRSMEPSVENVEYYMDCKFRNDYELDNQACPSNCDSSSRIAGDQMPLVANSFDSDKTSSRSTQQDEEVDLSESNSLPAEAEICIRQSNGGNNSELQDVLDTAVCSEILKDATASLKKSLSDKNQDELVIRPPPNAVPFSDEWLAAFEAAGEEILAKKGGAVQNSPPDKSLPEPGPWSPVRRKNNQGIGPYDCTKYTNTNIQSSTSN